MGKQGRKKHFFDRLEVKLRSGIIVDGGKELSEIEERLRRALTDITAELNRLSSDGVIDELAERYRAGEERLGGLTNESRAVYAEIISDDALPKLHRRRWLDTAISRIRDILKEQASMKQAALLINSHPELDDGEIARHFYAEKDAGRIPGYLRPPKSHEIRRLRSCIAKTDGIFSSAPDFEPKLALSRADDLSAVSRKDGQVLLDIGIEPYKHSAIAFDIPDNPRYTTGKPCKPDLLLNDKGEVVLSFAFKHNAPESYEPKATLGVDLGVLYPFTAAVMTDEWRSQVVYPDDEIMSLVEKMNNLVKEKKALINDVKENERAGRNTRVRGIAERKRKCVGELAVGITRLKKRIADLVAHRICVLAANTKAEIAFEQLDWSCPSHAFFHSLIIENTENLALRLGIPVRKVSARNTSKNCPECGTELKQGRVMSSPTIAPARTPNPTDKCPKHVRAQKRHEREAARKAGKLPAPAPEKVKRGVKCPECGHGGHHDAVSTYNIAKRARGCGYPRRFVRLRFYRLSWSVLPPDLAADSVRQLTPVQDILLPSPSKTKALEAWSSQSGKSPLFA